MLRSQCFRTAHPSEARIGVHPQASFGEDEQYSWRLRSVYNLVQSSSYSANDTCSHPFSTVCESDRTAGQTALTAKLNSPAALQLGEDVDISWYITSQPAEAITRQALLGRTPQLSTVFEHGQQTLEAIKAQRLQKLAAVHTLCSAQKQVACDKIPMCSTALHQDLSPAAMHQSLNSSEIGSNMTRSSCDTQIAVIEHALRQVSQTHKQRAQLFHQLMTRSSHFHHKFVQAVNHTLPSTSPIEHKLAAAYKFYTRDLQQHIHQELDHLCRAMHLQQVNA